MRSGSSTKLRWYSSYMTPIFYIFSMLERLADSDWRLLYWDIELAVQSDELLFE